MSQYLFMYYSMFMQNYCHKCTNNRYKTCIFKARMHFNTNSKENKYGTKYAIHIYAYFM